MLRVIRVYGSSDVAAVLGNQQKRLRCCLPCRRIEVALRQLGDVVGGIAQRAQLTAIAPRDRIKEGSGTFLCCSSGWWGVPDLIFGADIKINMRLSFAEPATPDMFAGHFSKSLAPRMKKKPAPFEVKCEACNGTGFPPVIRPARPGRRIYPPPCTVCGGKGRISTQAAKKKKNEPRRE